VNADSLNRFKWNDQLSQSLSLIPSILLSILAPISFLDTFGCIPLCKDISFFAFTISTFQSRVPYRFVLSNHSVNFDWLIGRIAIDKYYHYFSIDVTVWTVQFVSGRRSSVCTGVIPFPKIRFNQNSDVLRQFAVISLPSFLEFEPNTKSPKSVSVEITMVYFCSTDRKRSVDRPDSFGQPWTRVCKRLSADRTK
jgi:hypothetical protein